MKRHTLLLLALLPACSTAIELHDPVDHGADLMIDAGLEPDMGKPKADAETDMTDMADTDPDTGPDMEPPPVCVDEDGDGYGEDCPAGPDCDDENAEIAPGAVDRCNGVDDNCDGEIDESFIAQGLGDLCTAGVGTCSRPGQMECTEEGDAIFCNAVLGEPAVEICNGLDDDCDGTADEGVPNCCSPGELRPCGSELGRCTLGEQQCSGEQIWGPCSGVEAGEEICNGIDDNCDGVIDEGTTNACGQCGEVPVEICNHVDDDCDGAIDEGVANACGQCEALPVEICDGIDNDCDNRTDEGVTNACGGCGPVPREICDGRDNNCDNRIDEGVTNACGACGPTPPEICDGIDNDCDGITDDGVCAPNVDACANPPAIRTGQLIEAPIGGAPANHRGRCAGNGPDRAYRYRGDTPFPLPVCVTTAGSDFDTVLYVRSSCAEEASEVACNDDSNNSLQSQVQFTVARDIRYIFVDSYSNNLASGTFRLQITPGACP